jgi:hypothetical protein
MKMRKLYFFYEKNKNVYFIIANRKVIWQLNPRNLNVRHNLILSKNLKNYIFFLLNMSIFGLYPIKNKYEFKKIK